MEEQPREPDPRFTLANERTFLAWIRTSLALIAGGFPVSGAR
jgi:putative membrane protein